ncbi:MAG: AgmX/PglI C-terminal domain-containing protein, partial [Proteobacteria bacterium]|nr:AgmX/PglI C-terminal domain-containing protein [Pseudomonadota bacterium]
TDCYQDRDGKKENLNGSIVASWEITSKGDPENVMITKSTLNNESLEKCITDQIKTWEFYIPVEDKVTTVEYTFEFEDVEEM